MLVREVRYAPWLCRFGLHRWVCFLAEAYPEYLVELIRRMRENCGWGPVHVHACKRCGRMKLRGLTPIPERLLEGRRD